MKRNGRAGVTLMELLIAVSLVSLISVGILMAMRVGLNAMEKANSRLLDNRRVAGAQKIIEQQIGGIMAVVADCQADPSMPPIPAPFFQGEPQSLRFVSSYSLEEASRGRPRILEYQVVPRAAGPGSRLVVNELLYSGPLSTGMLCLGPRPEEPSLRFRPIEVGPRSFVLADRLAFCRFAYLEPLQGPPWARWTDLWVLPRLPAAIRVEWEALEPDPSRLPLLTITLPVRVSKMAMLQYTDQSYAGQ
jgi:hypothetical protein